MRTPGLIFFTTHRMVNPADQILSLGCRTRPGRTRGEFYTGFISYDVMVQQLDYIVAKRSDNIVREYLIILVVRTSNGVPSLQTPILDCCHAGDMGLNPKFDEANSNYAVTRFPVINRILTQQSAVAGGTRTLLKVLAVPIIRQLRSSE